MHFFCCCGYLGVNFVVLCCFFLCSAFSKKLVVISFCLKQIIISLTLAGTRHEPKSRRAACYIYICTADAWLSPDVWLCLLRIEIITLLNFIAVARCRCLTLLLLLVEFVRCVCVCTLCQAGQKHAGMLSRECGKSCAG